MTVGVRVDYDFENDEWAKSERPTEPARRLERLLVGILGVQLLMLTQESVEFAFKLLKRSAG